MASDTLIPLGQFVNTHATRGELRLRLYNPLSTALAPGSTVVLRRRDEQQNRCITAARVHKQFLLVTLDGCDSMTAAEMLVGYEVCVREQDLPPLAANQVYHYQLVGMAVVTTGGVELGAVAEVMTTKGNDLCVVRGGTKEYLIPLIGEIVKHIDPENRRMLIDPLPGLFDT